MTVGINLLESSSWGIPLLLLPTLYLANINGFQFAMRMGEAGREASRVMDQMGTECGRHPLKSFLVRLISVCNPRGKTRNRINSL